MRGASPAKGPARAHITQEVTLVDLTNKNCDLIEMARLGTLPPVIGLHVEARKILETLIRLYNSSALVVGAEGTGKRSIVNRIAHDAAESGRFEKLGIRKIILCDSCAFSGA